MVVKQPGLGGSGKISPSSLEASTVDLSAEFTGLITTQRAYSASSKIITTADQMLDELIQMKR
jgi:flagellar hook protein FlgE